MRSVMSLLIVLLSVVAAAPAGAAPAMPESGTRIRVTALEHKRWIGPLVSVAHDTVTMRDGDMNGALVTIPALQVMRFEISRGNRPNCLREAGEGLAIGALFGAVVGYVGYSRNDFLVSSAGESAVAASVGFGVLCAAVGAARGALTHSEHWRALPLEDLRDAVRP